MTGYNHFIGRFSFPHCVLDFVAGNVGNPRPMIGNRWQAPFRRKSHSGGMVPSVQPPPTCATTTVTTTRTADWESFFTRLLDFYLDHGHCEVTGHDPGQHSLRRWVSQQREELATGRLSLEHRLKLSAIGFTGKFASLPAADQIWERHFTELVTFHNRHRHFRIPRRDANYQKLRAWLQRQRRDHHAGRLPAQREQRLKAVGLFRVQRGPRWDWTLRDAAGWEPMFAALRAFHLAHGHFNVPAGCHVTPGGQDLKNWVARQRLLQRLGRLPPNLEQSLAMIGLAWESPGKNREHLWLGRLAELAAFQKQAGHCRVPVPWPENPKLAQWVRLQRVHRRNKKLSPEHIARLDTLGFDWNDLKKSDETWNARFAELAAFQKQAGHCRVPVPWPENPRLARWVRLQRVHRRNKKLSPEHIARLDTLGFDWNDLKKSDETWNARFAELAAFQKQTGHCHVPVFWPENLVLAGWVDLQRRLRWGGKLPPARIALLDTLGFYWGSEQEPHESWDAHFTELAAYHRRFGNCRVPPRWPENPALARWVTFQRAARSKRKLSPDRLCQLETLGFEWSAAPDPATEWDRRFAQLLEFRRCFGHCQVPLPWPERPALGLWVQAQREQQQAGTLAPEHRVRLDKIKFLWTGGWEALGKNWERKQKAVLRHLYRTAGNHPPQRPPA
jgi:hypothetical protein